MYVERRSRLPGAVVWRASPDDSSGGSAVLPDGCMDLIWLGDHLIAAGPDTRPQYGPTSTTEVIGLRFAPGAAPSVLGVPAHALRDQRVALAELWAPGVTSRWHDRVAGAERVGRQLEELAGGRLAETPPAATLTLVARRCAEGQATPAIAAEVGWSERTLRRHALDAFGYGTKALTRILRFQRAAALIRGGRSLAEVAADLGYADQSHLSREVRELSGRAPTQLR